MFENYKTYTIVSHMKKIIVEPDFISKFILKDEHEEIDFLKRCQIQKEMEPRFNLLTMLYKQYELNQFYVDYMIIKKKFLKEMDE